MSQNIYVRNTTCSSHNYLSIKDLPTTIMKKCHLSLDLIKLIRY